MTRPLRPEGNRNALLALHFQEGDPHARDRTRAHVETCARCREYLEVLGQVEQHLLAWPDEDPPADLVERLTARVSRTAQAAGAPVERRVPGLWVLLPLMPVLIGAARVLAERLTALPYWAQVAQWPGVALLGTAGLSALLLLVGGGLATLALAPALLLESQRGRRPSLA